MSENNQLVPNLLAPIVDPKTGKLLNPWNIWFQQFTQEAQPIENVERDSSNPFITNRTFVSRGHLILDGDITGITIARGNATIPYPAGTLIFPISIGDVVRIIYGLGVSKVTFVPLQ